MLQDRDYLDIALQEAQKAAKKGEVPVGSILVYKQSIIAKAHNLKEKSKDITQHAEIIAIKKGITYFNDWRLNECTLYTTLEPCPMCAGAIIHARIKRMVFGTKDFKWGSAGTKVNLFKKNLFNHTVIIDEIKSSQCGNILTDFFKQVRY